MRLLLRSAYWRTVDGLVLLIVAGAAVMTCAFRFAWHHREKQRRTRSPSPPGRAGGELLPG